MTAYSNFYIKVISENLHDLLGLPEVTAAEIRDMYNADYPLPLVKHNDRGCVWLDVYYAAFMLDDGILRYVYLSKHHIMEETEAYIRLEGCIPDHVNRQFEKAMEMMGRNGTDVWLETRDYTECPADTY